VIVLDTHVWLWWASNPENLSKEARATIENTIAKGRVHISSISVWEVAMLVTRGRLELSLPVADWVAQAEQLGFLKFVPVTNRIALTSVSLPGDFHSDPADRIIVATAFLTGASLVTADEKIIRYGHVKTIW
jgi:PIN domain nuclease of toxin-antitoxin system